MSPRALAAVLASAALALAAASLVLPWALAFDPYAWLVWGREVGRLELDTSAGPSWKPLPVLVTTLIAPLGSEAGPAAWLVVARAGALLALAGAGGLALRLGGGRIGAAAAICVLALSPWWWFNAALGNSEGLLAASVLWAAVAHLAGRHRLALVALLAGSLLRPEVWPFLGLYGLWLAARAPRRTARPLVAASFAAVLLLWFLPGVLGGGGASNAAQGPPSAGSAALADVPFLAVLVDAAELLTVPVAVSLLATLLLRDRRIAVLAGAAAAYVLLVAVMTQAGYAGNPRYLVPAAALLATLAAVGAAGASALFAAALVLVVVGVQLDPLRDQTREVGERAALREGLARRVPAGFSPPCGPVRTSEPQRTAVAWWLDLPIPATSGPPTKRGAELRPGDPWAVRVRC